MIIKSLSAWNWPKGLGLGPSALVASQVRIVETYGSHLSLIFTGSIENPASRIGLCRRFQMFGKR